MGAILRPLRGRGYSANIPLMGHIAEAEVESGRIFAQRLVRSPYLKSWDASWPDSGRGIAELRSARKYGGLNQRYFDSTSPPIEPRCTAAVSYTHLTLPTILLV